MNDTDSLQISRYEFESGVAVVAAQGDVDLCTTPTLRQALDSACTGQAAAGTVAVDMRDVSFIDSAGLALLVEMRKRFGHSCDLALIIAAGSQPDRVLKLGRFDTFLRLCYAPEELSRAA